MKIQCPTCLGTGHAEKESQFQVRQPICPDCRGTGEGKLRIAQDISVYDIESSAMQIFGEGLRHLSHLLYGRKGVIFLVYDTETGTFAYHRLGDLPIDKVFEKLFFATEKVKRLIANPDHISSFQSEDVAKQQFGGAIRLGRYILSTSGFPPNMDQLFCVLVAVDAKLIDEYTVSCLYELTKERVKFWEDKMAKDNPDWTPEPVSLPDPPMAWRLGKNMIHPVHARDFFVDENGLPTQGFAIEEYDEQREQHKSSCGPENNRSIKLSRYHHPRQCPNSDCQETDTMYLLGDVECRSIGQRYPKKHSNQRSDCSRASQVTYCSSNVERSSDS
jgi:hypothetical protein